MSFLTCTMPVQSPLCGPKAPPKSWPGSTASPSARQMPKLHNLCHEPLLQDTSPPTIAVQPIRLGERRNLIQGQAVGMPRYASSGHLIYAQAGNLMAVPFDVEHMELKGEPISVVQDVLQSPDSGAAQFSISSIGSLVYAPSTPRNPHCKLVLVRPNGLEHTSS